MDDEGAGSKSATGQNGREERCSRRRGVGQLYIQTAADSLQQTAFLAWPPPPPVPHWIDQLPQGSSQRRPGQVILKCPKKFWFQQMVDAVFLRWQRCPCGCPPGNASSGATNTAMPWLVFHFLLWMHIYYTVNMYPLCLCTISQQLFHFICINHVITACHMLPFSP